MSAILERNTPAISPNRLSTFPTHDAQDMPVTRISTMDVPVSLDSNGCSSASTLGCWRRFRLAFGLAFQSRAVKPALSNAPVKSFNSANPQTSTLFLSGSQATSKPPSTFNSVLCTVNAFELVNRRLQQIGRATCRERGSQYG